jgi:membrane-associated phospholipid phosphatase
MRMSASPLVPRGLEAQDIVMGLASLAFAAFSLAWPDTGASLPGIGAARGYSAAAAFFAIALFSLVVAPLIGERSRSPLLLFLRRFYPQAFCAVFFQECILLSGQVLGGYSHDRLFAAADQAIFGYQPSIAFSSKFGHIDWLNELMFGSYFSYFVLLAVTPWIPYLRGDKEEARRQVFVFTVLFLAVDVFYVFFRVQGPKYWFPVLRDAWYGGFGGGFFVSAFQESIGTKILSGAAFPSTHVIVTFLSLRSAFRTDKRLFAAYVPIGILIILSTVYIFAHYAVDAAGGAAVALLFAPLLERALPRIDTLLERRSSPTRRARPEARPEAAP